MKALVPGHPFGARTSPRAARWTAGGLLALSLSSPAAPREVVFSVLLPEADRVYLTGSFNDDQLSDDALMSQDRGLWRKTLSLENGTYRYAFKAEGEQVAGEGWILDWKSSRASRQKGADFRSVLVVPDDLDAFQARQRGATETEAGIEIPLFYESYPDKNAAYRFGGYSQLELAASPPPGGWTLPALTGAQPLFALVQLGDSKFLAAFDRKSADDPFYGRVHFDRNGNGDLTDEEPLPGKTRVYSQGEYFDCSFPPVDVEIDVGGHGLPYRFALRLGGSAPSLEDGSDLLTAVHGMLLPLCAYLGEFSLDGAGYRLALCDSTADGFTGDPAKAADASSPRSDRRRIEQGDTFYLSPAARAGSSDGMRFGRHLSLGDRLFSVRADVPGGRMVLEPRSQGVGALELPAPLRALTMGSDSDGETLMVAFAGERAAVPAGSWRLLDYQLRKKDDWGDEWLLQARGVEGMPPVTVPQGGSARLTAGEPLQAVVEINDRALERAAAAGSLRMSLALLGNAKERITDLRRISGTNTQHKMAKRDPNRPEEAAYRILAPDGERIASGSFEYG